MFRLIGRHFKEAFQGLFRHFDSVIASAMAVMFTLALVSLLTLIIGNVGQITKSLESDIGMFCRIDESGKKLLERSFDQLGLSARAYDKILRVARTIADLEGSESIAAYHLAEAVQYRALDRKFWK